MQGLQPATESGQGPQCCKSSPFSMSGWRMVQSAKKLRVPSLAAASTSSAVMAPWISVSQTTGMPLSFKSAFAALEHGVGKAAVRQVCKGHAEAPEHLAGGKEAALRVAQARAVWLGALVQRAPEQNRDVQILGQPRAEVLGAEVAVRQKQALDTLRAELLEYPEPVVLAVKQALLIDVVNVHEVHAQFLQALCRQVPVLDRVGRAEYAAPRRSESQFDLRHT